MAQTTNVGYFEGIEQPMLDWAENWLTEPKHHYRNGEWATGTGRQVITSINPATGRSLGQFYEADSDDVHQAVLAAREAFESGDWKTVTRKERAKILRKISDLLETHRAELATLETLDNGKLYTESYHDALGEAIDIFEYYAGWTDKYYGEQNPVEGDFLSITTREPIGVCGQILPFNFPLDMAAWKLAPALAMGNVVVIKPSEKTSFSLIRLVELIDEANLLPKGVLNLVLGGAATGEAISKHMYVDKLAFTGSTAIGKQLVHNSADSNLKPITLELGGKSPNIIFEDAPDIQQAIERSFYGLFTHKGEKCSAPTRLFVQQSIYEQVVEKIGELAEGYIVGDPFSPTSHQGAQISEEHMHKILSYIQSGKEQGARLVAGGIRALQNGKEEGFFVRPTIFADVSNDMKIAQEEIFGPVLCILPFTTEQEVIEAANDTIYGLAAGLWTRDVSRANRVAKQLEAGMIFINKYGCYDFASPFGGLKQSGWGKEYAIHSLQSYTKQKAIWFAY